MINVEVRCIRKTQDFVNDVIVSEITFQPIINQTITPQFAVGAAIGTPNTIGKPTLEKDDLTEPVQIKYNLNGALTFNVYDSEEASRYEIGQIYHLSLDVLSITEARAKPIKEK